MTARSPGYDRYVTGDAAVPVSSGPKTSLPVSSYVPSRRYTVTGVPGDAASLRSRTAFIARGTVANGLAFVPGWASLPFGDTKNSRGAPSNDGLVSTAVSAVARNSLAEESNAFREPRRECSILRSQP